ncbi:hypothetical protein [Amycolatopsis sp. VC5-11]|uniref:hypothetical protein n=1 Tax=Amycolatopsis sp. VC5-11 TaxID=3120156 RepID=UPI00300AAEF5
MNIGLRTYTEFQCAEALARVGLKGDALQAPASEPSGPCSTHEDARRPRMGPKQRPRRRPELRQALRLGAVDGDHAHFQTHARTLTATTDKNGVRR